MAKKILDKHNELTNKELQIIAAHQAGKVLTHLLLGAEEKIEIVTIKAVAVPPKTKSILFENLQQADKEEQKNGDEKKTTIEYGSMFTYKNDETLKLDSHDHTIKQCKILLSGNIAEETLLGSSGYSYQLEDKKEAFLKLSRLLSKGLPQEYLSKAKREKIKEEVLESLEQQEKEVAHLLKENKEALQDLALELEKKRTLTEKEILEIVNRHTKI